LVAKSRECVQGAHIGKLEFWWIHGPGKQATPENADGLVCFQFVQSCAANFARVLHLSVVSGEETWQELMPSAIFEVRKLVFGTLPVDSLRAVVLSAVDDNGKIYVDGDVEVAFEKCRFRWFQLTQSLRRTRSSVLALQKRKKLASRFLVLNAYRAKGDPEPPRSDIRRMTPLLLKGNASASPSASPSSAPTGESASGFASF